MFNKENKSTRDAYGEAIFALAKTNNNIVVVSADLAESTRVQKFAKKYPERFAAIAPVCGGGNPLTICKIGKLPVWAFHGAKDPVVALKESLEKSGQGQ